MNSIDNYFQQTQATQNVTIKVGSSDYGEDRVLSAGQTYDLSTIGWKYVGVRQTGRLLSYRLEASANQPIVWYGAEAKVAVRGSR